MLKQKLFFFPVVLALGALAGVVVGFNTFWVRQGDFPAYGWLVDLIAAPLFVALLLYARRLKRLAVDEFAVAKKNYAIQISFRVGLVLFCLTGLFPILFKTEYHAFLNGMDGADDAFTIGRVFGIAPFFIGLLVGQVASWAKYR
jgi:hypothetical protein